jgi:hypothetical protein
MISADALTIIYKLVKESESYEKFLEKFIKSERESQQLIKSK